MGVKLKSPEEHARDGRKLVTTMLIESLKPHLSIDNVESIWLIGAIEYSDYNLKEISSSLRQGVKFNFKFPTNFSFEGDYIDFYQVTTKDNRYFIYAMSNRYDLAEEDDKMMLVQIHNNYTTNHKRVYRVYTQLNLNIRRKPKKRLPPRTKVDLLNECFKRLLLFLLRNVSICELKHFPASN